MKKRIFTLCIALAVIVSGAKAQVAINATNFPDANFRNWLLDSENINGYGADGVLSDSEIANIKEMYPRKKDIQDMTGIAYFTALESLLINDNKVATLDLSKNTKLTWVGVTGNPMTSLTVKEDIEKFWAGRQDIAPLNISRFKKLKSINIAAATDLTSFDASNFPDMQELGLSGDQLKSIDVTKNPKLTVLQLDGTGISSLDLTKNPKLQNLQLSRNAKLPTVDLSQNKALTSLRADENSLTTMDLSGLTALETVYFLKGTLQSLDLTGCASLRLLYAWENQMASLKVSGCTSLKELTVYNNQLTTLDASNLPVLESIGISYNQLASLNVAGCTALKDITLYVNKMDEFAMQNLVQNLPDRSATNAGWFAVIATTNPNEGNVITKPQVAAAKAKNWDVNSYNENDLTLDSYEGTEPTGIETIDNSELTIGNCYDLNGRRVAQPTQKGVYISNGRKIVVK